MAIDATARLADGARIGDGVEIGPYCVVGPHVELKDGVRLIGQVNVTGVTTVPGFWNQVQQGYANRICTSLPSSLRIAWKGVLKPRHFLGVRLAVMTMS